MCKSKEQGGQRCSAHAKAALTSAHKKFLAARADGGPVDPATVDRFLETVADYVSADQADGNVLEDLPVPDDVAQAHLEALLTLAGENRRSMHGADYRVWRADQLEDNDAKQEAARRERDGLYASTAGPLGTMSIRNLAVVAEIDVARLEELAHNVALKIDPESLKSAVNKEDTPMDAETEYNSYHSRLMRRYLLAGSAPGVPEDLAGPQSSLTGTQVDAVWRRHWAEYGGDVEAAREKFPKALKRASAAFRQQVDAAAAMSGNTGGRGQIRVRKLMSDFEALPVGERPSPPSGWIKGVRFKDGSATNMPDDPATLWSVYRLQADPTVLPDDPDAVFASIDLETAGPDGDDGFKPSAGSIIEVAVVRYNQRGEQVGSFTSLARPADGAELSYRTGAVDVHGIEWDEVASAPPWSEVSRGTSAALADAVLLAHNTPFEQSWLSHHIPGHPRYEKAVDTLRVARQHLSGLTTHRLEKVCSAVGVDYTGGHRAEHDAKVAGVAFFLMRDRLRQEYQDRYVRQGIDAR